MCVCECVFENFDFSVVWSTRTHLRSVQRHYKCKSSAWNVITMKFLATEPDREIIVSCGSSSSSSPFWFLW